MSANIFICSVRCFCRCRAGSRSDFSWADLTMRRSNSSAIDDRPTSVLSSAPPTNLVSYSSFKLTGQGRFSGPSEGYSSISGAMSKSRNTVIESQAQAIEAWLMKQKMGNVHDSVKKRNWLKAERSVRTTGRFCRNAVVETILRGWRIISP